MKNISLSTFIDRVTGKRLILLGVFITILFAAIYFSASKLSPTNGLILPSDDTIVKKINIGDALYFSIITETTLGYGDIRPVGFSRGIACFQVILGLIWAGLIVAKITSSQSKRLRSIRHKSEGYWLEPFKKNNEPYMFTFSQIFYDGEEIRYEGDNYDANGEYQGSFKSYLITEEGNTLKFYYKNLEKFHLYVAGILELTFSNDDKNEKWVSHKAICHDHEKSDTTKFRGYRANKNEIDIFKSDDLTNKQAVITKYIAKLKLNPYV